MSLESVMILNPKLSIIIISFIVTLVMTLVTKKFTDQNRMKELKKIQKECQIKLRNNKGDLKKQGEINKEIMSCSMELMKHSFKPIFITFIPILLVFWWIRSIFSVILTGWIWWYLGAAIISSIILRKALKVV